MNTHLRAVTAILLTALSTSAGPLLGGGAGGIVLGGSKFDLDELDAALVARGYDALESSDMSAGIWGFKIYEGGIVLGGQVVGSEQITFNETSKTTVNVGGLMLNLGHVIYQDSDFLAYPFVGIGNNSVGVKIVERMATPAFDEILLRPSRESEMSSGGLVLQLGLGVNYLIKLGRQTATHKGLMLGVRVGYTHDPSEGTWKMRDQDVLGGPDGRSSGAFAHVTIGWGRLRY